jgi:hypothetical protein
MKIDISDEIIAPLKMTKLDFSSICAKETTSVCEPAAEVFFHPEGVRVIMRSKMIEGQKTLLGL